MEMAFTTLKIVWGPLTPTALLGPTTTATTTTKTTKKALAPLRCLQVTSKEEQEQEAPKAFSNISRREMMLHLAAASLSGITLLNTRPVEARLGKKLENKRKAMEKLKKLREKTEPKTEDGKTTPPPSRPLPPPFPGSERSAAAELVGSEQLSLDAYNPTIGNSVW